MEENNKPAAGKNFSKYGASGCALGNQRLGTGNAERVFTCKPSSGSVTTQNVTHPLGRRGRSRARCGVPREAHLSAAAHVRVANTEVIVVVQPSRRVSESKHSNRVRGTITLSVSAHAMQTRGQVKSIGRVLVLHAYTYARTRHSVRRNATSVECVFSMLVTPLPGLELARAQAASVGEGVGVRRRWKVRGTSEPVLRHGVARK